MRISVQDPPRGTPIYYSLGKKAEKINLKVVDYTGQTVRELNAGSDPGLHKVVWDLRRPSARTVRDLIGGQADPEQVMRRGGLFTAVLMACAAAAGSASQPPADDHPAV